MNLIALIPARAGSKRIPGKNTRLLGGHPLIAYTIAAAQQSRLFSRIVVCTDDPVAATIALDAGVTVRHRDPVSDTQADIDWVSIAVRDWVPSPEAFAILRPTSPFRSAETIRLAWQCFRERPCSSLRAVRRATENPYKMWWTNPHTNCLEPFRPRRDARGTPYHSLPSQQTMGALYVQTGGLDIAWMHVLYEEPPTISGEMIQPFHLEGPEALDLNTETDWQLAETLLTAGAATLPPLPLARLSPSPAT